MVLQVPSARKARNLNARAAGRLHTSDLNGPRHGLDNRGPCGADYRRLGTQPWCTGGANWRANGELFAFRSCALAVDVLLQLGDHGIQRHHIAITRIDVE